MVENTVRIHGYDIPVEKIAEAEEMVLGWSDEEEANRDEPCICFFSKTYHTGWLVVEGGDASTLLEADFCIFLKDALEEWRRVEGNEMFISLIRRVGRRTGGVEEKWNRRLLTYCPLIIRREPRPPYREQDGRGQQQSD